MIVRPRQPRSNRRGFTLIEVLVAMLLMTIVLPVTMRGMQVALAAASNARRKSEAAVLAQSKLNEIVQDVLLADTSSENQSGDFAPDFPDYRWTCQSTDDANLGLTQLTMTVMWTEKVQQKTMSFSTLVVTPTQ